MSWHNDPDIASFASTSPLPTLAARLMRARKVNFFCDQLFVKEPGSADSPTPWHHDQVVFPIAGTKTVSFWICLDPVTRETGALGAEALLDSYIVLSILKVAAGRERPDLAGGDGRFFKGKNSFPSGHSMMSWSLASVVAHEYKGNKAVPVIAVT